MDFKDPRAKKWFGEYPQARLDDWKAWHAENPEVYRRFKKLAEEMKARRKHYSGHTILDAMRFMIDLETTGDVFKINSDYRSMYIRLLIYHHPEYEGFFDLRKIKMKGRLSADEKRRRDEGKTLH